MWMQHILKPTSGHWWRDRRWPLVWDWGGGIPQVQVKHRNPHFFFSSLLCSLKTLPQAMAEAATEATGSHKSKREEPSSLISGAVMPRGWAGVKCLVFSPLCHPGYLGPGYRCSHGIIWHSAVAKFLEFWLVDKKWGCRELKKYLGDHGKGELEKTNPWGCLWIPGLLFPQIWAVHV